MAFKSTKGSGVTWNPTQDADGNKRTKATKDDILDGYYVGMKTDVGENNSNVYTITKEDGSDVDVWGTTVLNNELAKIPFGTFIRIQWHGRKYKKQFENSKAEFTSKNSFHDFEVFVDDETPRLTSGLKGAAQQNDAEKTPANVQKGAVAGKSFAAKEEDDSLPF